MLALNGVLQTEPSARAWHVVSSRVRVGHLLSPRLPHRLSFLFAGEEFALSVPPLTSDPLQSARPV